ncbi:hypothetical protein [Aureimonas sp. Leaf454]|uniref:hypothetical protein n=1 Tax=Aureimonas sp. Leaf454 TaxID=1736381 RepID=UPI000A98921E|nr:hypothetical protein [Aureimonas sp. Leaf454]
MTKSDMSYSIAHPRIRAAGFGPPTRPAIRPTAAAMRRAAMGPHRGDPDRFPRWG